MTFWKRQNYGNKKISGCQVLKKGGRRNRWSIGNFLEQWNTSVSERERKERKGGREGGREEGETICIDQHFLIAFSTLMDMFYICAVQYESHMWLLNTRNVDSAAKELNFKFYLIFIHLNLNSHMWLMGTILNSTSIYTFLNWENSALKNICWVSHFWESTTLKILTLNILHIKRSKICAPPPGNLFEGKCMNN